MERAIFNKGQQKIFINNIKYESNLSFKELGNKYNKSGRTFIDWYNERTSMPYNLVLQLSKKYSVPLPLNIKIKPQFWHTKKAGKLGGLARISKYGNPGTIRGRQLGGLNSQITNKILKTNFKQRKIINIPKKNILLAEFFGILLGDGGISKYQVGITLNNQTDNDYGKWIIEIIDKLFKVKTNTNIYNKNTLQLTVSGKNLINFLLQNGLYQGSKIQNQVDIPKWIINNVKFTKACIRGLIDTDGCVYIDKHKYKNYYYQNICIDFTNASMPLLNSVYNSLIRLSFSPKKYSRSIKLRREMDVKKYFEEIGSSNPKHIKKLDYFFKSKYNQGEVA